MLIVKSKIREYIKSLGEFNVAGDFIEALDEKVKELINKAAERTAANKRKTLSARDV